MTTRHADKADLTHALAALKAWGSRVSTQPSRHVWSVLPLKHSGVSAGGSIEYTEDLDRRFMDQFFLLRSGDRPYFDPFSMTWLQEGYYHSNLATSRKKTFNNSWRAGSLNNDFQSLATDYASIFRTKALTKSGVTTALPAFACAIWFYKRPKSEWSDTHPFVQGLPSAADTLAQFRVDFHLLDDQEWNAIFDPNSPLDAQLRDRWS